jgi:hypothetical protein
VKEIVTNTWFRKHIVTILNSDNVIYATFGLYPSYVAGILNTAKQIDVYVLYNKQINYTKYIQKYILGKECTFKLLEKKTVFC